MIILVVQLSNPPGVFCTLQLPANLCKFNICTRCVSCEAALLNIAMALTEGFQSPNGQGNWKTLVAPESWTLTGLDEESMTMCLLEAGKQLSSMLDLMEEGQTRVA